MPLNIFVKLIQFIARVSDSPLHLSHLPPHLCHCSHPPSVLFTPPPTMSTFHSFSYLLPSPPSPSLTTTTPAPPSPLHPLTTPTTPTLLLSPQPPCYLPFSSPFPTPPIIRCRNDWSMECTRFWNYSTKDGQRQQLTLR